MSFTNVLFPDPETPVTEMNTPSGNRTSMSLRLFWVAPRTVIASRFGVRRRDGVGIRRRPER